MNITEILNGVKLGSLTLGDAIAALITALIILVIIKALLKITGRLLSGTKLDGKVQGFIQSGVKIALYIVGALIVLEKLGIEATSLVALVSVFSLGITLAAEDIIANLAGGLVIISSHPFAIGDVLEADGVVGTVKEIRLYHTKLQTADGLTVLLPNKALSGSKMINYTALGHRRVSIAVTASYDASTEDVKAACWDAVNATENVMQDPAPSVILTNYGSSAIEYTILCWTEAGNFLSVKNGINEKLRETFAAHNVEMTYDHLNVHVVQ